MSDPTAAPSLAEGFASVTALATFRGQPGEGRGGFVTPGDVLVVDRTRAAELRANNLVRDAGLQTVVIPVQTAGFTETTAPPTPGFIGTQPPTSGVRDTVVRAGRTVVVSRNSPGEFAGPATATAKKEKA